jgi:hypothetical protein
MSIAPFASASGGFTNITNYPDIPPDSAAMRAQFETPITELINYINSNLLSGIADISGWTPSMATFSYTSADSPTFVMASSADVSTNFYPAVKVRLTQDATTKYFITTASLITAITMYGGTDYILTSSPITNVSFSTAKAPFGFPLEPLKWTVEVDNATDVSQTTPTNNIWYNLGSISIVIPIGSWQVDYSCAINPYTTGPAAGIYQQTALSTSASSVSDTSFMSFMGAVSVMEVDGINYKRKNLFVTSKTTYYLIDRTISTLSGIRHLAATYSTPTIIRAVCAYL